jgi:saccharopine dehydrogenase-like NADP-dependent oxidoreductase
MKHIILFGAGKSATCLIDYLKKQVASNPWKFTLCDSNIDAVNSKLGGAPNTTGISINVEDEQARKPLVQSADVVISLLPASLHFLVAKDCVEFSKHLLTASYVDEQISNLKSQISDKKILFLCEMGLDPGIDHMSAMKIIHDIKAKGGKITSFKSHCGGLVAPESDDNPWRYKISWNPRNVVMAGKAGAIYRQAGKEVHEQYKDLFKPERAIDIEGLGHLSYYPNRDSLSYMDTYDLKDTDTFVRTTLRFPEFCYGWKNIIELHLTDETVEYDTDGMTLKDFFKKHFAKYNFSEWLTKHMSERLKFSNDLLEKLLSLQAQEEELKHNAEVTGEEIQEMEHFMMVDDKGDLKDIGLEDVRSSAANAVMIKLHEANLAMKQLMFLGLDSDELINKGKCSAADVLQFVLENKLALKDGEKDMIVMLHEFEYNLNGQSSMVNSSLIVIGQDNVRTAMAKTVGLPIGIAAKLILEGKLNVTGLHIPVIPEIYEPVLKELEENGIRFKESSKTLR